MKICKVILFCFCVIPFLTGCMMTVSLWDQGTVHRISERKLSTSGNSVHFQAKETIRYPFPPFYWTSESKHDRIFTARSGMISEWLIEPDPQAPRFNGKSGLPMYRLPDKSVLLRSGDQVPDSSFHLRQTRLKVHPDDIPLLQKPFLFRGYSVDGKLITTLQIPVSFRSGKLKCCLPEDSGIVACEESFRECHGLPQAWRVFWTPLTVVCDILLSPVYFAIQCCK